MIAFAVVSINDALARYFKGQAPILDSIGCQDTNVMTPPIEKTRELTDSDCTDYIGRWKRKTDDQKLHLGRPSEL